MTRILLCLAVMLCISCTRENVNPDDYKVPGDVRPNELVLKPETRLLSVADKSDIIGINQQGILVEANSPMLDSIQVGSILVNTASDPGDTLAYYRRVTEIFMLGNNKAIRTVDIPFYEAFSRYVIDTRSSEIIVSRTNYFPVMVQFEPELLGGWVAVTAGMIPNLTGDVTFDADSTYFTAQYDENGSIPFQMYMQLKDLRFNLSGQVTFQGEVEAGIDTPLLANPILILPIAETGLSLYAVPKMDAKLKVGGSIVSPQLTITSGPHNFSMSYDETRLEPFQYTINPRIVPTVSEAADWSATGSGSAELQVGAEVYLGITGLPTLAKAGFFLFGYAEASAARKGNFTDLQPRVSFDSEFGIGANAFAELTFLANIGLTLSSPDLKFAIKKWHIGDIQTCTKYGSVDMFTDNFQSTNQIYLDVVCPGCAGNGFSVWVNDLPIDNGFSFPYNQSATITLPPELMLLNSIAIQDETSLGCYLMDDFLDPTLFNSNCTQFTDARDGNTYCSVQVGNQFWMGENLRYAAGGTIGHWYLNEPSADTLLYGRLYTFSEILNGEEANTSSTNRKIKGICPQGWHIPSQEEWAELKIWIGPINEEGKYMKLPNAVVWPGADLPASSVFNATSAGEYYPWFENKNDPVSGNRYKKTTFWTSTRGMHFNGTHPPVIVEINEDNYLNLGTGSNPDGFGSIEEIGYSCRCIKD